MNSMDIFGIRMIYPTNTEPNKPIPWFLGKDEWRDRAPNWDGIQSSDSEGNLQLNVTRSGSDKKIKTRFRVQSIAGQDTVTEKMQNILRDRKFMGTEKDWKNVEITFYAKINKINDSNRDGGPHFEIEARSGMHGNDHHKCEGTSLHTNIYPNGRVKLEKELSHTDGYTENDPQKNNVVDDLMDRWFGMKGIFYDVNDDVKLEIWLDKNANNDWGTKPVLEYTDKGGWKIEEDEEDNPHGENRCGGKKDERIVWGGPIIIFRSDQLKDFYIKCASVREIQLPN